VDASVVTGRVAKKKKLPKQRGKLSKVLKKRKTGNFKKNSNRADCQQPDKAKCWKGVGQKNDQKKRGGWEKTRGGGGGGHRSPEKNQHGPLQERNMKGGGKAPEKKGKDSSCLTTRKREKTGIQATQKPIWGLRGPKGELKTFGAKGIKETIEGRIGKKIKRLD